MHCKCNRLRKEERKPWQPVEGFMIEKIARLMGNDKILTGDRKKGIRDVGQVSSGGGNVCENWKSKRWIKKYLRWGTHDSALNVIFGQCLKPSEVDPKTLPGLIENSLARKISRKLEVRWVSLRNWVYTMQLIVIFFHVVISVTKFISFSTMN